MCLGNKMIVYLQSCVKHRSEVAQVGCHLVLSGVTELSVSSVERSKRWNPEFVDSAVKFLNEHSDEKFCKLENTSMTDDSVTNSNSLNGCFNKAVIVGEVVGSVVFVREN